MGQTTSNDDVPDETPGLESKEVRLLKKRSTQVHGGRSLQRGASLPSRAPRHPDEELIQLPPGALAALAKLQDPDGYRRLMREAAPLNSSRGWSEDVGCSITPRKSDFTIFEDGALRLPSRGFSPIPDSAPLSATPIKVRGPLSPAAGRRLSAKDCPVPPPPTPAPHTDVPAIIVYSTPPRVGHHNASASPAAISESQVVQSGRKKNTIRTPAEAERATEVLRDIGNREDITTSWNSLVKLSELRRVPGRCAKENEACRVIPQPGLWRRKDTPEKDSTQKRDLRLEVAQTPPLGHRLRGKDSMRQRQLNFTTECTLEEPSASAPIWKREGRRKMCCPCT